LLNRFARCGVKILERYDGGCRSVQAVQQGGANVPCACQQRRHSAGILTVVRSVAILGVRVDDVTYAEALAVLLGAIGARVPHVVTTPNPEIVMLARRDAVFRAALNRAALNIPDGIGLILAARLAGDQLREHVQGTDLVLMLAAESAKAGHRWFLLGGQDDVAARAASALAAQFPGLVIAGADAGSPNLEDDASVRNLIRAQGPVDVVLVAYGAPKQELWLDRNLAALEIPVGIGVGGVFNYLSGATPRAPRLVRRLHFEWLHRLITQPWRWRRQLALPAFAALALVQASTRRVARRR
jgi:N-acetylglucosaminyldiphosphoundecaprenol N-acetyl-beta-D-mannosaminyltransferase